MSLHAKWSQGSPSAWRSLDKWFLCILDLVSCHNSHLREKCITIWIMLYQNSFMEFSYEKNDSTPLSQQLYSILTRELLTLFLTYSWSVPREPKSMNIPNFMLSAVSHLYNSNSSNLWKRGYLRLFSKVHFQNFQNLKRRILEEAIRSRKWEASQIFSCENN